MQQWNKWKMFSYFLNLEFLEFQDRGLQKKTEMVKSIWANKQLMLVLLAKLTALGMVIRLIKSDRFENIKLMLYLLLSY